MGLNKLSVYSKGGGGGGGGGGEPGKDFSLGLMDREEKVMEGPDVIDAAGTQEAGERCR